MAEIGRHWIFFIHYTPNIIAKAVVAVAVINPSHWPEKPLHSLLSSPPCNESFLCAIYSHIFCQQTQDFKSCYLLDGHWRFRSEVTLALLLSVQHMAKFTPNKTINFPTTENDFQCGITNLTSKYTCIWHTAKMHHPSHFSWGGITAALESLPQHQALLLVIKQK